MVSDRASTGEALGAEESLEAITIDWEAQFAAGRRTCDMEQHEHWLRHCAPTAQGIPTITKERIVKILAKPVRSAPGPDGVTYLAWAAAGEGAAEVLWAVAQALMSDRSAPSWLNASLMILIPARPTTLARRLVRHAGLPRARGRSC